MHLPASVRVYLCTSPCDMRRSFDGLHALVIDRLQLDAFAGHLFVFANRRGRQLRVLWWDDGGFSLLCRRLHQALFQLPKPDDPSDRSVVIAWPVSMTWAWVPCTVAGSTSERR